MGSKKVLILLGLLLAFVLLISSEVSAAKDLADAKTPEENKENVDGVDEAKYGGHINGRGGYNSVGGYDHGGSGGAESDLGGHGGGGYCRHGCCDHGSYQGRGCRNCCRSAAEAIEHAKTTAKPQN
ncbi:Glycine rich protein [Macleaya cordata]|uniref:Glycine rich protein n=1 Tax=Macleaya cordata TaxID=56857 RepID=A0A200RBG8_MACCD|nr:Glycine rich protein [Macleaya cordata]